MTAVWVCAGYRSRNSLTSGLGPQPYVFPPVLPPITLFFCAHVQVGLRQIYFRACLHSQYLVSILASVMARRPPTCTASVDFCPLVPGRAGQPLFLWRALQKCEGTPLRHLPGTPVCARQTSPLLQPPKPPPPQVWVSLATGPAPGRVCTFESDKLSSLDLRTWVFVRGP